MNAKIFKPLAVLALGSVAFVTPLGAQSGRIVVGGAVSVAAQYRPQSPQRAPYPPDRQGPQRYPGGQGPLGYGTGDYARSNGYSDGYKQGVDAGRDRDLFDPRRERWYRQGDRGYQRNHYMSRDQYRDYYRHGFMSGYDAGYQDGVRQWNGNRNRRFGFFFKF